jgi:hypothetical protein
VCPQGRRRRLRLAITAVPWVPAENSPGVKKKRKNTLSFTSPKKEKYFFYVYDVIEIFFFMFMM